jgi:hypothetical protein
MNLDDKTQVVDGKTWSIGEQTPLGTIKSWFTNNDKLWFSTEEGNQFKSVYLIGCK